MGRMKRNARTFKHEINLSPLSQQMFFECMWYPNIHYSDIRDSWISGYSMVHILSFIEQHGRVPFGKQDCHFISEVNYIT